MLSHLLLLLLLLPYPAGERGEGGGVEPKKVEETFPSLTIPGRPQPFPTLPRRPPPTLK